VLLELPNQRGRDSKDSRFVCKASNFSVTLLAEIAKLCSSWCELYQKAGEGPAADITYSQRRSSAGNGSGASSREVKMNRCCGRIHHLAPGLEALGE
jgi:hypothetical protein